MRTRSALTIALAALLLAGCGTATDSNGADGGAPATSAPTSAPSVPTATDPKMTASPPAMDPTKTTLAPVPSGLKTPPNATVPDLTCPAGTVVLYPDNGVTCAQAFALYTKWQGTGRNPWTDPDGTLCVSYQSSTTAGSCTKNGKVQFLVSQPS